MDKAKILKALTGSITTIAYVKDQGHWPIGADKQYDYIIRLLNEAIQELANN